jgi:predicted phage-related endonuclease
MLTPAQIEARKGKLTGSRVKCLMSGKAEDILNLYREMTGDKPEDDLSDVWAVQHGIVTEPLNLRWFERKQGMALSRHGEVVIHPWFDWAACTLDAWCEQLKCPVEAKAVGGNEPLEVVIDRYQPQVQWQMECTEARQCALSVIIAGKAPVVEFIDRDAGYAEEMLRRGAQFMQCVARRTPPVALPAVPSPAEANRLYDMTGNNMWGEFAGSWLEKKPIARACDEAEKILKSMVPADAKKCTGHGVYISRDRAGRLSLREDK